MKSGGSFLERFVRELCVCVCLESAENEREREKKRVLAWKDEIAWMFEV